MRLLKFKWQLVDHTRSLLREFVDSGLEVAEVKVPDYMNARSVQSMLCKSRSRYIVENIEIITRQGRVFLLRIG